MKVGVAGAPGFSRLIARVARALLIAIAAASNCCGENNGGPPVAAAPVRAVVMTAGGRAIDPSGNVTGPGPVPAVLAGAAATAEGAASPTPP